MTVNQTLTVSNDSRGPHRMVGDVIWHGGRKVLLTKKVSNSPTRWVEGHRGNQYSHEDWQEFEFRPATADDLLEYWRKDYYNRPGGWWKKSTGELRPCVIKGTAQELGLHVDETGHLVRDGQCELHCSENFEWQELIVVPDIQAAREFISSRKNAYGVVGWFDESGAVVYSDYV